MIPIRNFSESVSPGYKQYYLSKKDWLDKEVAKIKWIPINEIEIYDWAFSHDIRISAALEKFKKTYIR